MRRDRKLKSPTYSFTVSGRKSKPIWSLNSQQNSDIPSGVRLAHFEELFHGVASRIEVK